MVDGNSAEVPGESSALTRLRTLEDRFAIVELLHRVCFTIDAGVAEDWLACFIADGIFSWARDLHSAPILDLRGRDALASWFAHHRESNPVGSQTHIVLHPVVKVSGDDASVHSSYMTLRAIAGDVVVASAGNYFDHASRGLDGSWRLVERRAIGSMMRAVAAT